MYLLDKSTELSSNKYSFHENAEAIASDADADDSSDIEIAEDDLTEKKLNSVSLFS
jgi:hypothetical protein